MPHHQYINQEKHLLAVDCVTFGYEDGLLKLLLFKRELTPEKGKWSLVGGWVETHETVEEAAARVLRKITGLQHIIQEQVAVFSDPARDTGDRVVSVAFYALIDVKRHNKELLDEHGASWFAVSEKPPLIFDHSRMVAAAWHKLREKASYTLVGRGLLPEFFTLTSLRQLYNSIFVQEFDPGNFRKKVLALNALQRLETKDFSESKKGAYYYRFRDEEEEVASAEIKNPILYRIGLALQKQENLILSVLTASGMICLQNP